MTISSTTRKAGPFSGTGAQSAYPFTFKVFAVSDVHVVLTDASGVEYALSSTTDYSVSLNSNQEASPGGTVNLAAALPVGDLLTIGSAIPLTQGASIPNMGGFYPKVIEQALDKLTIAAQQAAEVASRALRFAFSDANPGAALPTAQSRAGRFLAFDAIGNPTAATGTGADAALRTDLAAQSSGSSLVSFIQSILGAVRRTVQDKLRESVSADDFGADPFAGTDSTAAINAAISYLDSRGGGRLELPGSYMVTNLVIDKPRIILVGRTGGFTYEKITDPTSVGTRLIPGPGAVWVIRFKGTATGAAAQGSGLRNAVIIDTSPGEHEYGLIEDCAGTIIEDVTIQDFQYNHVMPAAVNANVHRRVARLGATKMGFLVSEFQAKSYMHPSIPDIPDIGNTVFFSSGGLIRQNEWGIMIRDAIGASLGDTVIESNRQSGGYIYRVDVSTVRAIRFCKVHFENNYDGITADKSVYSITGNRAFLIGDSATYIAWTAAYQAGYQLVIDSQTHGGTGGADNLHFDGVEFNCDNPYQRDILQLSGTSFEFNRANFGGTGDDVNRVLCTADANATLFWEPSWKNDPTADVPALVANFGANLGTRGALVRAGKRNGELGGLRMDFGALGGALHLPGLPAGDPRRDDLNVLHLYQRLDTFAIPWRTASAFPFTLTSESNTATVIGREVIVKCKGTMTVSTVTGASDKFFCDAQLPFQAGASGNLTGNVLIEPTGGGATVVNNGWSPMKMNAIASVLSVFDVFPALAVGMTFSYEVELTYATAP